MDVAYVGARLYVNMVAWLLVGWLLACSVWFGLYCSFVYSLWLFVGLPERAYVGLLGLLFVFVWAC